VLSSAPRIVPATETFYGVLVPTPARTRNRAARGTQTPPAWAGRPTIVQIRFLRGVRIEKFTPVADVIIQYIEDTAAKNGLNRHIRMLVRKWG
jgi:hypothetical protein